MLVGYCEARSSPQWWSGRSTTVRIVLDHHSLIWGFGESRTIVNCITAQPAIGLMCYKMWSFDIFVILRPFGCNFKGGTFRPSRVWGSGRVLVGSGMGPLDNPPMGSYWFPVDTYGLYLTVLSYLAGPVSVSARSTLIRWQLPLNKLLLRRAATSREQFKIWCVSCISKIHWKSGSIIVISPPKNMNSLYAHIEHKAKGK